MMPRLALSLLVFLAGCSTVSQKGPPPAPPAMTAAELAAGIRAGTLTAEAAVRTYLERIAAYDRRGPMIQSVLALNPDALAEARVLDAEARAGTIRGALHGVPVLVKDNIETKELPTTAGSLALIDNDTGRDAPIVARLRAEGAIILGKTNLSEWANFRSETSISGWSGVGGQTRNPHSLDRSACGSSSGSGAAVAAQLAPLAIGTETNGSIICPAAMTGIVGFKPTVGLLSRSRIVPISSTQDTAGPMTRTVRDAALMLTAMAGGDPADAATARADGLKADYGAALDGGIHGMRIGVLRWAEGDRPAVSAAFQEALTALEARGAVLVDIAEYTPPEGLSDDALIVLLTEFKATLNAYLAEAAPAVTTRTLTDLIAFNEANAAREMALFDQSLFTGSEVTGGYQDPAYVAARDAILKATREDGIDRLLAEHDVRVLVMPSRPPAFLIDAVYGDSYPDGPIGAGWLAAMAGYPILTVPMGDDRGLPIGLGIMGTGWDDATVLAVGHAYEQASGKITTPAFVSGPFAMPATAAAMRPHNGDQGPGRTWR